MSARSSYEYRDGLITCTIEGEGKVQVLTKPATPEEWAAFQCELNARGFSKHGEARLNEALQA